MFFRFSAWFFFFVVVSKYVWTGAKAGGCYSNPSPTVNRCSCCSLIQKSVFNSKCNKEAWAEKVCFTFNASRSDLTELLTAQRRDKTQPNRGSVRFNSTQCLTWRAAAPSPLWTCAKVSLHMWTAEKNRLSGSCRCVSGRSSPFIEEDGARMHSATRSRTWQQRALAGSVIHHFNGVGLKAGSSGDFCLTCS